MDQSNFIEINNNPEDWAHLPNMAQGMRRIIVLTQIKGALNDNQLFSLRQCFFALACLEYQRRGPVFLELHVTTATLDDAYRIQHDPPFEAGCFINDIDRAAHVRAKSVFP